MIPTKYTVEFNDETNYFEVVEWYGHAGRGHSKFHSGELAAYECEKMNARLDYELSFMFDSNLNEVIV